MVDRRSARVRKARLSSQASPLNLSSPIPNALFTSKFPDGPSGGTLQVLPHFSRVQLGDTGECCWERRQASEWAGRREGVEACFPYVIICEGI